MNGRSFFTRVSNGFRRLAKILLDESTLGDETNKQYEAKVPRHSVRTASIIGQGQLPPL